MRKTCPRRSGRSHLSSRRSDAVTRSGSWETRMRSNDASAKWVERYADVVQRLDAGPKESERKLTLAKRNLERARDAVARKDPDLALIMAEASMVNAADAVLARGGYRIRGKTGSHAARFDYPELPEAFRQEAGMLRAARAARNTAQYE